MSENLGIPIYLDTNTLLDLLASMDDGFSTAKLVHTQTTESNTSKMNAEGGFGISNVLSSIFKLSIKASKEKASGSDKVRSDKQDKYYTYGSLMNLLIKILSEKDLIREIKDQDNWNELTESNFILFQGKFIPNPLGETLTKIEGILEWIIKLGELGLPLNIPESDTTESNQAIPLGDGYSDLNSMKNNQLNQLENEQSPFDMNSLLNFIKPLLKDFEGVDFKKYIIEVKNTNYKVVSYLFEDYIRDRSGVELAYGEFMMLGKIVRKIETEGEYIDLLQGSKLAINEDFIKAFVDSIQNIKDFDLPTLYTKVDAPALQVIPIAIYI